MKKEKIYIITGGTINRFAPHLALCSPAYGKIGFQLQGKLESGKYEVILVPTDMVGYIDPIRVYEKAGLDRIQTNEDLNQMVDWLIKQEDTRCIVMAAAVCDFKVTQIKPKDPEPYPMPERRFDSTPVKMENGYSTERLKSSLDYELRITADDKIISKIRKERKDIFLVSFKTTFNETFDVTYKRALDQLKRTSSNLVFANDIGKRKNMIVTPEEYPYIMETREEAIDTLSKMILDRLNLHFHRTEVLEGKLAKINDLWLDDHIPDNFCEVLTHCIQNGAYKAFNGKTAGHFGCKVTGKKYDRISSVRKVDHNEVFTNGMAKIYVQSNGRIVAKGAKPSVGEHTQGMIYERLGDEVDSIIHFHCPMKEGSFMKDHERSQMEFECGSDECGINTAGGMHKVQEGLYAVHLRGHGPNIAFSKDLDKSTIIKFIDENWDMSRRIAEEAIPMI